MSLTARQQEVLAFIGDAQSRSGVMPSTREIQEHFGFASQTAAVNHLRALERHGVIRRQPGKARAVSLVSQLQRERIIDVPIYGQISAGLGEADENASVGMLSVDAVTAGLNRQARLFALKVCGDSMIGAQICEGDHVIMEMREPQNTDIVAAIIDGETTLKRFMLESGEPYLRAENPNFPDLVPVQELIIQGVMVALIRRYMRPAEAR
jgi:repressor LexA